MNVEFKDGCCPSKGPRSRVVRNKEEAIGPPYIHDHIPFKFWITVSQFVSVFNHSQWCKLERQMAPFTGGCCSGGKTGYPLTKRSVIPSRLLQSACRSVFRQDTEPQLASDSCAISICVNALYECVCVCVCEWVKEASSVKCFEWSIRLEKHYISAPFHLPKVKLHTIL